MENGWHISLTLDKVESGYRAGLLTYRELPDAREEKSEIFMVSSREEAVAFAQEAAARLGLAKFELHDRTDKNSPFPMKSGGSAMKMERRMLYIPVIHIDTNLINARQKLPAVNQLEKWGFEGVILINMSGAAYTEAKAGDNPDRTRKANKQIFTATPVERDAHYQKIASALFSKGVASQSQENDVCIVREAAKYQAILVTSDGASRSQPGGILGNRDKLRGIVTILTPEEAIDFVRGKIRERDDFNRRIAEEIGGELPEWTGKD